MSLPKRPLPATVTEQLLSPYREVAGALYPRRMACLLAGVVVGERAYDATGRLLMETPLQNGLKHGREFTWDDDGQLSLVEPYVNGQIHGTAKQYGARGRVIGTYTLRHGTGYDVWRCENGAGKIFITEIHSMQAGLPHGYEWWCSGPQTVWHERHWAHGELHGIERLWNDAGQLSRGYPRYWVRDQRVTKRHYLRAAQTDATLPPFCEQDNQPRRRFPVR